VVFGARLLVPPGVRPVSVAVRVWVGCAGECGGEEAVGPVFGVAAGVGEDEVDFGVADFEACELVGEPVAVDVFELVEGRVSGFDDDCGEGQFGESLQLEGECSVGERGGEVVEAFALDRGEDRAVRGLDGVVAGGNGRADRLDGLLGAAVYAPRRRPPLDPDCSCGCVVLVDQPAQHLPAADLRRG
jgi:hypothetical protein